MSGWRDRDPTDWACLMAFVVLGIANLFASRLGSSFEIVTDRMVYQGVAIGAVWALGRISEHFR